LFIRTEWLKARFIMTPLKREIFEYALRSTFVETNNEIEYEAIIPGL